MKWNLLICLSASLTFLGFQMVSVESLKCIVCKDTYDCNKTIKFLRSSHEKDCDDLGYKNWQSCTAVVHGKRLFTMKSCSTDPPHKCTANKCSCGSDYCNFWRSALEAEIGSGTPPSVVVSIYAIFGGLFSTISSTRIRG